MWIRATGAILRIILGAGLVAAGLMKLRDPGFLYGGLLHRLSDFGPPFAWYGDYILLRIVEPHMELFAYAVPLVEIAAGLSFLLGFLVSWAASGTALLILNIGLATGRNEFWILPLHAALAFLFLMLGRAGAGLTWGLDGLLANRLPPPLLLFPLRRRLPEEFRRTHDASARLHPGQIHGRRR